MCRWLKLTKDTAQEEDAEVPCKLLTWTLRTCGYKSQEQREGESDPIDCLVDSVRVNVIEAEVDNYADKISECIDGLPKSTLTQYQVGVNLMRKKLEDYRAEEELMANATALAKVLASASDEARQSLHSHTGEEKVIRDLEHALSQAEQLPGHYLVEEIHGARRFLERLLPIPAVRQELRRAIKAGETAMKPGRVESHPARELGVLWPIIVRLNVSVNDAEHLHLGPPLPEARKMLARLNDFRSNLLNFRTAMFIGNVSLGTKSDMASSVSRLNTSLPWAKKAGLAKGIPRAEWLLTNLEKSISVLKELRNSTAIGEYILEHTENTGLKTVDAAVEALNESLILAGSIGIGKHAITMEAQVTLDRLTYLKEAREALHRTVERAKAVLDKDRDDLSDGEEERATDELRDAMNWADEVSVPVFFARDVESKLARVEEAKGNMSEALVLGEASYKAKVGEQNAIKSLSSAVAKSIFSNVTAGVADAQKLIEKLKDRLTAKQHLTKAETVGKAALSVGHGYRSAIKGLKVAMDDAEDEGLKEMLAMAQSLIDALESAWDNQKKMEDMERDKKKFDGAGEGIVNADAGHKEATGNFQRSGYRVVDLADPENSLDDGDDDFDEHLAVLRAAIDEAHRRGEIDPDFEVNYKEIVRKGHAYFSLHRALEAGEIAMKTKARVESAIEMLETALGQAREAKLELDVPDAIELLELLRRIEPAMLEFQAAMLQANISLGAESHMGSALIRLKDAVKVCTELGMCGEKNETTAKKEEAEKEDPKVEEPEKDEKKGKEDIFADEDADDAYYDDSEDGGKEDMFADDDSAYYDDSEDGGKEDIFADDDSAYYDDSEDGGKEDMFADDDSGYYDDSEDGGKEDIFADEETDDAYYDDSEDPEDGTKEDIFADEKDKEDVQEQKEEEFDAAVEKKEQICGHMTCCEARFFIKLLTARQQAHMNLKAAIVQGEFALGHTEGEEAALRGLVTALAAARKVDLRRDVPVAVDLRMELTHMNTEQGHLADAVSPLD